MKSVRLSQSIRCDIRDSVLKGYDTNGLSAIGLKTLGDLDEVINQEERKVLLDLWHETYTFFSAAATIPDWALADSRFSISVENTGNVKAQKLPGRPGKPNAVDRILTEKEYAEYFKRYLELVAQKDNYLTERSQFKSEVSNLLDSVSTTMQLVEVWPTVEQYIPAYIADPDVGVKLPALLISRLDEKLGTAAKVDASAE